MFDTESIFGCILRSSLVVCRFLWPITRIWRKDNSWVMFVVPMIVRVGNHWHEWRGTGLHRSCVKTLLSTSQGLTAGLLVSPAQKWSTRIARCMGSFFQLWKNSAHILLTYKAWRSAFDIRELGREEIEISVSIQVQRLWNSEGE